jgi:3-dehydroquinate synthase
VARPESTSTQIVISTGVLGRAGALCRRALGQISACCVVTDSNVGPLYAGTVVKSLRTAGFEPWLFTVPAGENSKSLHAARRLYAVLHENRFDRTSFIIALGGGIVGDLAGFVAATYMRGIRFVQLPTSFLAMVDSSIGGKTAVNHLGVKNLIGAFHQPALVLMDPSCLRTLPKRQLAAGAAEAIKCAVIGDPALFRFMETHSAEFFRLDAQTLKTVISRCAALKLRIVRLDERDENGIRARLNLGHTVGHAVESATGFRKFLHGEAVAIGMCAAARIAAEIGKFPRNHLDGLVKLVELYRLPTEIPRVSVKAIVKHMESDKKSVGSEPRFVLPVRIGGVVADVTVPRQTLRRSVKPNA